MQFFIHTGAYDPNSGGAIALHRLCHLINEKTPHSAYLVPFNYQILSLRKKISCILRGQSMAINMQLHPNWNTPIWHKTSIPKKAIAIYPEITDGNPMGVDNVVRWFLHQPAFHTGKYEYGDNELYFKFNSAIKDFSHLNSVLSQNELKVIYYPIDVYFASNEAKTIESCHMVRKGGYKPPIHSADSVALDGKSHQEIAEIFRKAKRFICYDDYTAYSIFAVLCGCESVVVPSEDVPLEKWYPNESDRFGIAYGLSDEQLAWAAATKDKVLEHVLNEHKRTEERVKVCLDEMLAFFEKRT